MALTEIGMKRIAVIGGGITGITTAYTLAKRGLDVTVYEKHRYAAMETSFANGGQLSASNAEVWNNWQTVMKGIKWMSRRDAPLLTLLARPLAGAVADHVRRGARGHHLLRRP